jgi:predicted nucleic acid-binding protein
MEGYQPPYQYVLDTSALFDLKDRYPEAVFPTIWQKFNALCDHKYIIAPKEVEREIRKGSDLMDWLNQYEDIFLEPCDEEVKIFQNVWSKYSENALQKYGTNIWADPLIIACAKHYRLTIITQERNGVDRIPTIAKMFDVKCIQLTKLFEEQGWIV